MATLSDGEAKKRTEGGRKLLTVFVNRFTVGFPQRGEWFSPILSDPVILLDPIRDSRFSQPPHWQDRE